MKKLLLIYGLLIMLCNSYKVQGQTSISVQPNKLSMHPTEILIVKYAIRYAMPETKYEWLPNYDWETVTAPSFVKKNISINGKAYFEETITYHLKALKQGKVALPTMVLTEKGIKYASQTAYVEVAITSKGSIENNGAMPNFLQKSATKKQLDWSKNFYIKRTISNKNPCIGEPILVTYYLYRTVQTNAKITKQPVFEGMAIKELTTDEAASYETIGNIKYRVDLLRKVQLVLWQPQQSIDGIKVTNIVAVKDEQNRVTNINKQITLPAISLPTKGLMKDTMPQKKVFGNYSIAAYVAKNEMAINEQNKLYLTITGAGNWDKLMQPIIAWPNELKLYSTTVQDTVEETTFLQPGSRTFIYQFIAEKNGLVSIPSVEIMYYQMGTGIAKKITTKPLQVNINGELKSNKLTEEKYEAVNHKKMLWLVVALIIIVGSSLYIRYKKECKNSGDTNAETDVINIVSEAEPNLTEIEDTNEALLASKQSIKKYLCSATAEQHLTIEEVLTKYKKIDAEKANAFEVILSKINNHLYGAQLMGDEEVKGMAAQIKSMLSNT